MRKGTATRVTIVVLALLGWSRGAVVDHAPAAAIGSGARRDLDVAIPPGSPTTWARRFPSITPGPALFPEATHGPVTGGAGAGRTVTAPLRVETDVQFASPFGVVRILTWDVAGHLTWVDSPGAGPAGPVTGASAKEPPPPRPGDALHWATTASLLRLLLHPQVVSEPELIAHLIEIGEPVLAMLDAARSEPTLVAACEELDERIRARRFGVQPIPGTTPRETMLNRFLVDELIAAHPYDPEGAFGRRLLLFAEELESSLAKYTRHHDPFVRRNAVAALGRLRSETAVKTLARVAADSDDPVMLMRALSALEERRAAPDVRPLLERLRRTTDPIDRVALVEALGRIGSPTTLAALVELGDAAYPEDPHLLQAVLAALVRIAVDGPEVRELVERVHDAARRAPDRFDVEGLGASRPVADVPDRRHARAQLLAQLASLWLCRTDPAAPEIAAEVLELIEPEAGRPVTGRTASGPSNALLSGVSPAARFLYVETLRVLGDRGLDALERIARDVDVEPALRGSALGELTPALRGEVSVEILGSATEGPEMQTYALDVLTADGHPRLQEFCRGALHAAAAAVGEELSPERRYLVLRCLRVLGSAGIARSGDILPLLELLTSPMLRGDAARERVRDMVDRFVAEVGAGMKRPERRARIDEILDLVVRERLHPAITERSRSNVHRQIERQLAGLRGHRDDPRYQELVAAEVTKELLGASSARMPDRGRGEFSAVVPLEEEILFALGREASAASVRGLVGFVGEHADSEFRAQACLALGMTGDQSVAPQLVRGLLDADPFTRFCAYESLRRLSGEDHWCDWMFGDSAERTVTAERYHRWARGR